jgi:hypothetical protein
MRLTAWTAAVLLAFTVGLNIRPTPTPDYQVETFVVTETETVRHPLTDTIIDVLDRDVRTPETDEQRLFDCWMQLVQVEGLTDDEWHPTIAYIDRKWAGDTCQALDHRLEHGRY